VDFSKWKARTVAVTTLRLDPENPRLATSVKRPTQQELIADLLEHEDVLDLVRDIARQGFFPNELLVAIRDGANIIVIEGNRRLAALKLLLNPDLAPPDFQKRVRQHAERAHTVIDKVSVVVAPKRSSAVPLLIARHKGQAVKGWTSIMQARFLQSRLDEGLTVDQIAEETGLDRGEVVRELRDAKLYDVIRSLPLSAIAQQVVNDPRKFPLTTLRRLIEYSSVQTLLGMKTDEQYGFVTTLHGERFQKILTRIVTDIATDDVTSRSHNTSAEVDAYIADIVRTIGKAGQAKGKPTPADEFVDPSRVTPKPTRRRKPKAKVQKPNRGIIPKGFRVDIEDERIVAIVTELKSLALVSYPNASAITFRSLLDMAISKYLHDSGATQTIKAKLSAKNPKPADWVPTLAQGLNHFLNTPTIPLGPEARKALQKFLSDTTQSLTLDSLNWFTHIRYVPPTSEQLRSFWTMLTPLFEMTLQKP